MPTETAYVGAQLIPLPAVNAAFPDPTIAGLHAYFGFLIKETLDPALAALTMPATAPRILDACPAANRHSFDPMGEYVWPSPGAIASVLPGLWIWERPSPGAKLLQQTLMVDAIDRTLGIQYIFPQFGRPTSMEDRQGLLSAVQHAIFRGVSRGRHPSFAYGVDADGNAYQPGVSMYTALGLVEWEITGGQTGLVEPLMPKDSKPITKPANERCLPSFVATLRVREIVQERQPVAADRPTGDTAMGIDIVGDDEQPLPILNRNLPYYDGSSAPKDARNGG